MRTTEDAADPVGAKKPAVSLPAGKAAPEPDGRKPLTVPVPCPWWWWTSCRLWKGEARVADADKAKRASVLDCILCDVGGVDVQERLR